MKLGMLLEDKRITDVDLSCPQNGNPGIGGTSYMFLQLAHFLNKYDKNIEITLYRSGKCKVEDFLNEEQVENEIEALNHINTESCDLILFSSRDKTKEFYNKLDKIGVPAVGWAHNFLSSSEADMINDCIAVKRLVFVGKQEYDHYIDCKVIDKSTYIYNMFDSDREEYFRVDDYDLSVVYMGSLVPQKGFHILAKNWKAIIEKVPEAKLHVIGGGNLYFKDLKMGSYGIADENYEKMFMPYLTDEKDELLPSVIFHGTMGHEKIDLINRAAVGVMNPTSDTETFGLSAIEMEACGVPVVTRGKNGLLDTTLHKKSGFLFKTEKEFVDYIVLLLRNKEMNKKMGDQAKVFVKESFMPDVIIPLWINLFNDVITDKPAVYLGVNNHYFKDYKLIRMFIHSLRKFKPFANIPSLNELKTRGNN